MTPNTNVRLGAKKITIHHFSSVFGVDFRDQHTSFSLSQPCLKQEYVTDKTVDGCTDSSEIIINEEFTTPLSSRVEVFHSQVYLGEYRYKLRRYGEEKVEEKNEVHHISSYIFPFTLKASHR